MIYPSSKIGAWIAANAPNSGAMVFAGNTPLEYLLSPVLDGEGEPVIDAEGHPVLRQAFDVEGNPVITGGGDEYFEIVGGENLELPTEEDLEAWDPPSLPVAPPLVVLALKIQTRLADREQQRTGKRPTDGAAVPWSRALAAAAMILGGWGLPSVDDLTNDAATLADLAYLYADPTAPNTTPNSTDTAKRQAVQYLRVMREGSRFGAVHAVALAAYQGYASGQVRADIAADTSDWLDLPCGDYGTIRDMFAAFLV